MLHLDPKNMSPREINSHLTGGVAPRPIALVSTLSKAGTRNLSPFSFFNTFGANPPTVAIGPTRRIRDGSSKDTYHNLLYTKECVIQAVTFSMIQQMNISSADYPPDVDEFDKSGLTPVDSDLVKPQGVAESPFRMECRVKQIVPLGDGAGSGNLVICEVIRFHISEDIMKDGIIQPDLIDLVGRNSGAYYTRAFGDAIFELKRPSPDAVGYDRLPEYIKESRVYSANDLGQFASALKIPDLKEVESFIESIDPLNADEAEFHRLVESGDYESALAAAIFLKNDNHPEAERLLELAAKAALEKGDLGAALLIAVCAGNHSKSR
jgi:flavin reductase (DIM6/NTAB) family NADH-FMN oxidoreductase RutF